MSQYTITQNPQFDGADDFDFEIKHNIINWDAVDLGEGWEGLSNGYSPGTVKLADGTRLNKRYTLTEAVELAEKHPEVKAITKTRALCPEGTADGEYWYSLRSSSQVMTGDKSEAKGEWTWVKL